MTRNTYIYAISLLAVACVLSSCVKEAFEEEIPGPPSEYIRFQASHSTFTKSATSDSYKSGYLEVTEEERSIVTGNKEVDTRIMPESELDGLEASVTAVLGSGGNPSWSFNNRNFIFDFEQLDPETDEDKISWGSVGDAESMAVLALSPRPDSNIFKVEDDKWTYTADTGNPANHKDIIIATRTVNKADFGNTIPLDFKHALTGIRFKLGFKTYVKSLTIKNIYTTVSYSTSEVPAIPTYSDKKDLVITFENLTLHDIGDFINYGVETLTLPPQALTGAKVILEYAETASGTLRTIEADLSGKTWMPGKMITYTIKKTFTPEEKIYFDLAAGNVTINGSSYTGYRFVNKISTKVSGTHTASNIYHVYQSSASKRAASGITGRPEYPRVKKGTQLWGEYITNNTSVEDVIQEWDNKAGATATAKAQSEEKHIEPESGVAGAEGAVRDAGREGTYHNIDVSGAGSFHLIIDNIYSTYQETSVGRTTGGVAFRPSGTSSMIIYLEGDNRVGCVHYNGSTSNHKITFEDNIYDSRNGSAPGTLTVADVDYYSVTAPSSLTDERGGAGFYSNHWNSAIGNNDNGNDARGIAINSGVIFAGTTAAENCSAIGAGGNGEGIVTINGGVVTAVATTTGTAIGGGIGFNSNGGKGIVTISGGTVYAYNHANRWKIPSSAIGGGGSKKMAGATGIVTITNGTVYAQSVLGTAIGGGSSYWSYGGAAEITITGGKITAKSLPSEPEKDDFGAGIGGGTGCSSREVGEAGTTQWNGGNATVRISGDPIIRTGSIGGGKTGSASSYLGHADITVSGGDIQAQFIMEAGSSEKPSFRMSGGTIRESDPFNEDGYYYVMQKGGAVYMNEGKFTMTGGTIRDCKALQGGAVYITGDGPEFEMSGGTIKSCTAENTAHSNGGGLYIQNGTVNVSGNAEIRENKASNGGAIYLEGGTVNIGGNSRIFDNLVNGGNGGAVCILGGDFTIDGPGVLITENTALAANDETGNGGGVYVTSTSASTSNVNVSLLSGQITANSADRRGGGLCVDMDDSKGISVSATVKVGEAGAHTGNPDISGNKALLEGGGLYVIGSKADIIINNGNIKNNLTVGYVYNEDVANEKGMVALNDVNVTNSVVVTFMANGEGAIFDAETNATTATQNIVTSTNSTLVQPAYINRYGYTFKGWHTNQDCDDSRGKRYYNGDVMNLTSNLTLYAIWEK